ncbi:MAG TPA: hypothetical protein VJB02_04745 [Coxiellaceae bacterium]|nr:hypothetical protein [Coxiellaceae bacterium]
MRKTVSQYLQEAEQASTQSIKARDLTKDLRDERLARVYYFFHDLYVQVGMDVVEKEIQQLSPAEQVWVCDQIIALSIEHDNNDVSVQLARLYTDCGGVFTPEQRGIYETQRLALPIAIIVGPEFNWKRFWNKETAARAAVHAGFLVAVDSAATGALSTLFSGIMTGLYWIIEKYRSELVIAKGFFLVAFFLVAIPRVLKSLYKNIRNIFNTHYDYKKQEGIKRLICSSVFSILCIAITHSLILSFGPFSFTTALLFGWLLGHNIYKGYKRSHARKYYHGVSNPQKYFLKREEIIGCAQQRWRKATRWEEALPEERAPYYKSVRDLAVSLHEIIQTEKSNQRRERGCLGALSSRLWGIRPLTTNKQFAERGLRNLQRCHVGTVEDACRQLKLTWPNPDEVGAAPEHKF